MNEAKYLKITEDLTAQIQKGELAPLEMLPSENSLCYQYDLSRMSVRKGLNLLTQQGYITSVPGKGYFVNKPKVDKYVFLFDETKFIEDYADEVKLSSVEILRPDQEVSRELALSGKSRVMFLEHIFYAGGQPIAFAEKYFPYIKGVPFLEGEIGYASHPEKVIKTKYPYAFKKELEIHTELSEGRVDKKLKLSEKEAILTVSQKYLDMEGHPFLWGRMYIRAPYSKLTGSSIL